MVSMEWEIHAIARGYTVSKRQFRGPRTEEDRDAPH
jgi:hypothetical protein